MFDNPPRRTRHLVTPNEIGGKPVVSATRIASWPGGDPTVIVVIVRDDDGTYSVFDAAIERTPAGNRWDTSREEAGLSWGHALAEMVFRCPSPPAAEAQAA